MQPFGKSQSVARTEDVRFLTGRGRYVDDIAPENALFAYVVRSPVAHGVIRSLDVAAARQAPGVHLVWTVQDLVQQGMTLGMKTTVVRNIDRTKGAAPLRPLLAQDRVRHVGEAMAVIVADSLIHARDAADLIDYDIEELPVAMNLAPGQALHPEAPGNLAYHWGKGEQQAVEAALAGAAHVVTVTVPDNRIIVNAIEPRGCYAEFSDGRVHLAMNGQGVWSAKDDVARHLNLPADAVRVTTPDVGGGFGMKAMVYPEPILVAQAARVLGRPVRWIADRTESMLSDNAGRDLTSTATLGLDENLRIVAYRVETDCNLGAYNSQFAQPIQSDLFSKVAPGTYDIPLIWLETRGWYTNTTPVDAYRGAGRPEAIFVLERTIDQAARQLGVSPFEIRHRNFIRPDQFPYTSATGVTYDVGAFGRLLDIAAQNADVAGFAERRRVAAQAGRLRGLGVCYYIESILGDPQETTRIVLTDQGAEIYVGTQSNGQGHETVFARFLSDHTGIPADRITVVMGDSDRIAKGGGTGGSRSVTVQNTATLATVGQIISGFSDYLAAKHGAEAVQFDDERFRIPGSNVAPTLLEVAALAAADDRHDLLDQSATITLPSRSFPNGCHIAEVEIDQSTGKLNVCKYSVVDDFGNLINPMLAEGQVHGGVAQGLGQAIMEQVVFSDDGQLLTGSFMDYAMPRASDVPWIGFTSVPVPSIYNPMGMKGCGEAGTVGALAAVVNAAIDAVGGDLAMPLTPHRVWTKLKERGLAAS